MRGRVAARCRLRRLLQRRIVRRQQQGRVQFGELGRALGEVGLPRRILHRRTTRLEALSQVLVAPQMDPLVGLRELAGPGAPDRRVLLTRFLDLEEILAVLLRAAQHGAVDAQLIDVAGGAVGGLDVDHGVHHAQVLALDPRPDGRHVLLGPVLVLRELAAQALAIVQAVVLPQMPDLVQRAELGRPVAVVDAVIVAAYRPADHLGGLEVLRHLAGNQGVAAQFVDHMTSPLTDVGYGCGFRGGCARTASSLMSAPQPGRVGTISSPFWMTGGWVTRSSFQGTSSISISMIRKLGMAAHMLALIRVDMWP